MSIKSRFPLLWNRVRNVDKLRSTYAYVKSVGAIAGYGLGSPPPVLVYQMGSVGSRSIYKSLRQVYSGLVHHTHDLRPESRSHREEPIYKWCVNGPVDLYIVSLVRDPIAHNISRFFQNFESYTGVSPEHYESGMKHLRNIFMEKFDHEYPLNWYNRWKDDVGLDVFEYYTQESDYQKIDERGIKLTIMRTEMTNARKEEVLEKRLDTKSFSIRRENEGSKKHYANKYGRFKDTFSAPEWYIKKMYDSKFFEHFYTKEHKKKFRSRWEGGGKS